MNYFYNLARTVVRHPLFVAMRTVARFKAVRHMAVSVLRNLRTDDFRRFSAELEGRSSQFFGGADVEQITSDLQRDGVAFGLRLPATTVDELREFASRNPCWADRNPASGFRPGQLDAARLKLGRRFLLAHYFNIERHSPVVATLGTDPVLLDIAGRYLGTRPVLVGANMWWSYPENASDAALNQAAQMFHYDLDDFRFLKFFFYLTDVDEAAGPHVVVRGSHENKRFDSLKELLKVRRYSDDEVVTRYGSDSIVTITGKAGMGFVEDTLAIHKGKTPRNAPRLLLQLQYSLNDYGHQNDVIDEKNLKFVV